jgi:hypothetical protein
VNGIAAADEGPGLGWRGLAELSARAHLVGLAAARADGRGGWRRELIDNPNQLVAEVQRLLCSLDLLRSEPRDDGATTWWFSPALARWLAPSAETADGQGATDDVRR